MKHTFSFQDALIKNLLPKANLYLEIREKIFAPRITSATKFSDKNREPPFEKITEKFICYLWSEQSLKNAGFKTDDGKELKVINPGLWNPNPGPDFNNAQVIIGNEPVKGDVEIHLYASDWYRHMHHLDKNYNGLVLHVAVWDDQKKPIRLENKREVAQLVLAPYMKKHFENIDRLLELESHLQSSRYFVSAGKCYPHIKSMPQQKVMYFLSSAGEARMLKKMDNFRQRLLRFNGDYEEILYQGIMSALGYRRNQSAFLQLSEYLSYRDILKIIRAHPVNQQASAAEYLLLKSAGLLPKSNEGLDDEAKSYLKILNGFASSKIDAPNPVIEWQIPGGRPANSPLRRIAGMSQLLVKYPSLFIEIQKIFTVKSSSANLHKALLKLLEASESGFWSTRSSFSGKPFSRQYGLIGLDRANAIILNIIIPIFLLHSQEKKDPNLQESILNLYYSYPKMPENYYTRFMKQRLFHSDSKLFSPIINTSVAQQGLIEIFADYCKKGYEGCEMCGLLKFLKS